VLAGLACGLGPGLAAAAPPAGPGTHACGKLYDPPVLGRRSLAYRNVRADGVPCRVADAVLMHFIEGPVHLRFYPPHSALPKSEKTFGKTKGGWHCVQYFAHYGPPLGDGATRCTKDGKLVTATYVP
jgi:hypothetical protein